MKKTKGKHFKERKFILTSRFYALMVTLLGLISLPIFIKWCDGDITGSIFAITLGVFGYIGTYFKEGSK